MGKAKEALEAYGVRALLAVLRALPFDASLAAGRLAGAAAGAAGRRRFALAVSQLREAYGEALSGGEAERLARAMYAHLGMCAAELAWARRRAGDGLAGWVSIEGLDLLKAELAKGRGVLVASGHLGNWELGAMRLAAAGIPLAVVGKPFENDGVQAVLAGLRRGGGLEVIGRKNALKAMRELLRQGRCVGMLIDQDARELGVFVPFFGRPASTIPSLAAIALRTGAPVVLGAVRREPDRRTHVLSFSPVEIPPTTGDAKEDALRLTARMTRMLEDRIRLAPEQWFWMHRRWKTRPPANPPDILVP